MRADGSRPDWLTTSLGEVTTWLSGGTPSKAMPSYWGGDIPWVSPKDMKQFRTGDAQDRITGSGVLAGSRTVPADSVLIVVRGMILAHTFPVCLTTREVAFNQDVKAVLAGEGVDGTYLAHWFVGRSERLLGLVTEATHGTKRIDLRDLQSFQLQLPPLPEQRRIAEILDTLDEAIRKTEQVIAKLQQMKQGLLHDLLTRGIDEHGELRDPERHPEQFKDSPLGRIPRGWEVRRVGDLFESQLGKMLSKEATSGHSQAKYLTNRHVQWGRILTDDLDTMSFSETERAKFSLKPGDLLICEGGEVGRTAIWHGSDEPVFYQKALHRLRPLEGAVLPGFMARYMRVAAAGGLFADLSSQTSIAHLTQEKLALLKMPVPPLPEQRVVLAAWDSLDKQAASEEQQLNKLRTLKHGLMDDLLTGRVRVAVPSGATT